MQGISRSFEVKFDSKYIKYAFNWDVRGNDIGKKYLKILMQMQSLDLEVIAEWFWYFDIYWI